MVYRYSQKLKLPDLAALPKPPRKRSKTILYNQTCAFDIETTRLPNDNAVLYVWQFAIGEQYVVIGRTWEEFREFIERFSEKLKDLKAIVFVHNLSHEAQFLISQFEMCNDDIFCLDSRKILIMRIKHNIELRCSYRLTNLSLDALTKRYNVQYRKQSGAAFNYNKLRFSTTELTKRELLYCVNDVLGLVQAINAHNNLNGDTLYTMPFTQTGYIRRELKKRSKEWKGLLLSCWPDMKTYRLLSNAFRGGNTHASRYRAGEIVGPAWSYDICSQYPAQILCKPFPMTKLKPIPSPTLEAVEDLLEQGLALLMEVELTGVKLRRRTWPVPYLSISKMTEAEGVEPDNGRILSADRVVCCVTELDWKIIVKEYTFQNVEIKEAYYSYYDKLPDGLRDVVLLFYRLKTELKGQAGQENFYQRAKEVVNAAYGCMAQDPLSPAIEVYGEDGAAYIYQAATDKTDEDLLISAGRRSPVLYQWGVWVTAWARTELEQMIDAAYEQLGPAGFLYCDTDSAKTAAPVDFSAINSEWLELSNEAGATAADRGGKLHPVGVIEEEQGYDKFLTLGAKKYMVEQDGHLAVTIAGLPKKTGAAALSRMGGLQAAASVADGGRLVFEGTGKLESVYNDAPGEWDGIDVPPNVCLRPATYTLSVTEEYEELLKLSERELSSIKNFLKKSKNSVDKS